MTPRIVIDPDGLRRVAGRMRGAASLVSSTGRQLVGRPLPAMPPGVTALVAEVIGRVNMQLQELAVELAHDAGELFGRATWAELGDPPSAGPPWRDVENVPESGAGSASVTRDVFTDERLTRAQEWSLEVLDTDDRAGPTAAESPHLRAQVVGDLEQLTGEAIDIGFGEGLVDVGPLGDPVPGPWSSHDPTAAGHGALGAALNDLSSDPTGVGIMGCIAVGGGMGPDVAGETQ